MIKITDGKHVAEVPKHAFERVLSKQGFVEVGKETIEAELLKGQPEPEETEDEKFAKELVLKPISEWTADETRRFAAIAEVDISGTKNAKEAKEIIKTVL